MVMKAYTGIASLINNAAGWRGAARGLLRCLDFFNLDYVFLRGYSFPPQSVCLILSETCNLRCRMCDIGRAGDEASGLVRAISAGDEAMELEHWLALLRELASFAPRPLVLFTGTEPFVSPHADAVIGAALGAGLPVHVTTNGVLLERHAARLAGRCDHSGELDITVSLDGPPDVHDWIRGVPGVYDKAVRGIRALAAERARRGGTGPRISITCTVSNYNSSHLERFAAGIAQLDLPLDAITFNHLWFKDAQIAREHNRRYGARFPVAQDNAGGIDIAGIDMGDVRGQLARIRRRFGSRYRIHQFPDLTAAEAPYYYGDTTRLVFYDHCTAPWRNVAVTPRGRVIISPLCFLGEAGNLHAETFHAIWNGRRMRGLRRLLRRQKAFPACSRCCMLFGSRPKLYKLKDWFR